MCEVSGRPGGRLVTLAAPPPPGMGDKHHVKDMFFVVRPDAQQLGHLARMVDGGKLRPIVSQTFPLQAGREAFESVRLPHDPGKTLLIVR